MSNIIWTDYRDQQRQWADSLERVALESADQMTATSLLFKSKRIRDENQDRTDALSQPTLTF